MLKVQCRFVGLLVESVCGVVAWRHIGIQLLCFGFVLGGSSFAQEPAAPANGDATAPPAAATKYQTIPVHPALAGNTAQARQVRNRVAAEVRGMLRGDLKLDEEANKAKFDGWYVQYLFASMTQPENLATLDITRQRFLRQDLGFAREQTVHDYLVKDLTLPQMTAIVRGNFHPAVRYNAMLIISNLNIVEVPTSGQRRPPIPLLDSLVVITEELQNDKQSDAVKLAAWVGLLRHVQLNRINQQIPPNAVQIIRTTATKLLAKKDPPAGRSLRGHVWMQRRAIEVLAAVETPGAPGDVISQIEAMAANDQAPLSLRLTAARSLGNLPYGAGTKATPGGSATHLGALAAVICRTEMSRVEEEKEALAQEVNAAAGGSFDDMMDDELGMEGDDEGGLAEMFDQENTGGGDVGSNLSDQQREDLNYTKRMLKYRLYYVLVGLGSEKDNTGLFKVAADPANKSQVRKITGMVTGILEELEPPEPEEGQPLIELDRDQLLQKLRKQVRQLESATTVESATGDAGGDDDLPGAGARRQGKQG
jgi:hypothetical protein